MELKKHMETRKNYTRFHNPALRNQKSESGYKVFISDIAERQIATLSEHQKVQISRSLQSLSADPKPSTSNKRICIRSDSGSLYLIVSEFIIRYVLQSDQVLVNAISRISKESEFSTCSPANTTTKLTDIERAALARAVKLALDIAMETRRLMDTDPNYAGYQYYGFDSAATKPNAIDKLKMQRIVNELDKMNSYISSTVGLDTAGKIVGFLYDWFGPNLVDISLRHQKFDPEGNKLGVGFGKVGAVWGLHEKWSEIKNTESSVTCKADSQCEYHVNGRKFEIR